jgi:acetyl-CoA C-acetyltransferase
MSQTSASIVIVGAKRTAIGSFMGQFTGVPTPTLGATAIKAALEHAGVAADQVSEVIMGCVLPAGLGQAPARQAALGAGIPTAAGCTTLNKVCGSGMKATMLAADMIKAGSADIVVAGGMESMTNAPHLLNGSRTGLRYGSAEMLDHMAWDGLTDPYQKQAMGVFGELCAEKYAMSREEQDAFAAESVRRAQAAVAAGTFRDEIAPLTVSSRKGDVVVDSDEQPGKCNIEKISSLRPAFKKDGTITAASSSSISDGAAALVLMSESEAARRGTAPLARRSGSLPPRCMRSKRCSRSSTGRWPMSTCSRSTKRSPAWPWRRSRRWASRMTSSTSTAVPARWVTRSAPPARESSSP